MSRLWIWIGLAIPTLGLTCALGSLIAAMMPREYGDRGQYINGVGFIALPLWGCGFLLIAGVMFLIGRALIRLNQQDKKQKPMSDDEIM